MLVSKAARRYAIALLEISKEQKSVDKTLFDIQFIHNTIEDSRELQLFLKSPIVKPVDKRTALQSIFKKNLENLSMEFVDLIAKKERSGILLEITTSFIQEYNKYAGIIEVEVRTAKTLSAAQVKTLQNVLEKSTAKKVNLHTVEQEELKGGLLVKIDDTVVDGTIKHKLEQLEDKLLDNTVELN